MTQPILTSEFSPLRVRLDPGSGLPSGLCLGPASHWWLLQCGVRAITGGAESRAPLGGLQYTGTVELSDLRRSPTAPVETVLADRRTVTVPAELLGWYVDIEYQFSADHPRLRVALRLRPAAGNDSDLLRTVRNVQLDLTVVAVILDILLHGVIDKEVITIAADAVRAGPYAARRAEDSPSLWRGGEDAQNVAWSRHILDFEDYWRDGSQRRHPLVDEHPEWFARDSAGEIIGIYTKAFDNAHPGWQAYFVEHAVALMRRLDIDGYRFDAPTYNSFANWDVRTRSHASVSVLGCLPMFRQLRERLREVKPDAMLYREPSGILLRESMDLNYNYDEQFLFASALDLRRTAGNPNDQRVRNARELGMWLRERDAALPRGSLTAHHIDSHDTFWWPLPGRKWIREQFGTSGTQALMGVFALSGGPFMMFVGGEVDVEEHLRRVNRLRVLRPELAAGTSDYDTVAVDHDDVYTVLRRGDGGSTLVVINLADDDVTTTIRLPAPGGSATGVTGVTVRDVYAEQELPVRTVGSQWHIELAIAHHQVRVIPLE